MLKNSRARIIVSALLIALWFGIGSLGGPTFGKISTVTSNDQADFLPSSAESTQVQELQRAYQDGQAIPAIVIIESNKQFNPSDLGHFEELSNKFAQVHDVQGPVIGPVPSKDFKALEFIISVSSSAEPKEVVAELRNIANKDLPNGTTAYVTGPAGLSADLAKAFSGIDGLLLVVALVAVFIILLFVYRSALLPFLVLLNAMFALCAAIFVVYLLAKQGVIDLNGQSQGILSILVIGAATDYSLLLVARYREALRSTTDKWEAITAGIKGSFEPIAASAATVILALLCLLFSDLNSNQSLGPIAATGIVFSLLTTLTFLPALLALSGKTAFWPSKLVTVKQRKVARIKTGHEQLNGIWKRVGNLIATRARLVWIVTAVVLGVSSLGLTQLKANGVPQTDLVLSQSNAADGQKAIARHYEAGSGSPVLIASPQAASDQVLTILQSNQSLTDIRVYSERGPVSDLTQAKPLDGNVLFSATLTINPYSTDAEAVVKDLRSQLAQVPGNTLVGGTTALAADTSATAISDLHKIVPIVLVMIFIVLAILLRALLAPFILILTVVLSFAATLGISALVFNHIFQFPGADAAVPLFSFVFLVALGVDYNIFLVTRAREETRKYGTKTAMLYSLGKTGGVITSAGIVLATTFAALGIIPILFLAQIAFIVALGVLIDTFIVRSLLVPALFYELGDRVWWPSKKLSKTRS